MNSSLYLLVLFSVLGSFGDFWIFDLFSHFRFHYALFAVLILAGGIAFRSNTKRSFLSGLVILGLNGYYLFPTYNVKTESVPVGQTYKVLSANVFSQNEEKEMIIRKLKQDSVDFLFLFEINQDWANHLPALKEQMPFAKAILRNDNFGIGILSKYELKNLEVISDGLLDSPAIIVDVETPSGRVTLAAAHPPPPINSYWKASRDSYLTILRDRLKDRSNPVILCGDLNTTAWSHPFIQIFGNSSLRLPVGFGRISTWPASLYKFGIPIDHCLISPEIQVNKYFAGRSIASDHLPLEMTFSFRADRTITSKKKAP